MYAFRRSPSLLYFFTGLLVGALVVHNLSFLSYTSKFVSTNKSFAAEEKKIGNKEDEILFEEGLDHKDNQQNNLLNQLEDQQLLMFDHQHVSKVDPCIDKLQNSNLPTVDVGIAEGRNLLWGKTKRAFQYIYNNELENFDWFLKADDDTYVIVENLRFMLMAHSPNDPIYFGCRFKPFVKQGYMSGGSGYVLSKEAVRKLVNQGIPDSSKCKKADTGAEDAELGKCLAKLGVAAGDSRDSKGRHRMLPFSPLSHFESNGSLPQWFKNYMYYPYKQGSECCSDHMISFHYVTRPQLYAIHNLVYHIRPFGLAFANSDLANFTSPQALFESAKKLARTESMLLK